MAETPPAAAVADQGRARLPRSRQAWEPGGATRHATSRGSYAGDFRGVPSLSYAPIPDDRADPGEVVWAWVPFEEDHSRGKDRPALVIGRHEGLLLALPMTSKDHDRDLAQEASVGRHWCDVGSGAWDGRGRPSEVRVDRILQLDPGTVRRIGAVLPQERFERVADQVRTHAR
ncbi:type II toxin-antitoxin system PemK/MazF family toxin [Arsenicicoccus dermatophilus]|uniref:type II toxin-antitoxin system PemK/MazF family toxin n=1 Tax=Arsenicicoccus dermatophilus TaxID=1076331 RepID=UPI0039175BAD